MERSVDLLDGRAGSRRERAAVERAAAVEKCLLAAREVLREHSVFDLSAAVVAEVAGVTRQTVHNYYPTMHQLIFALADELTVDFQRAGLGLDGEARWCSRCGSVQGAVRGVSGHEAFRSTLRREQGLISDQIACGDVA